MTRSDKTSKPKASARAKRSQRPDHAGIRQTLYDIIFEADTPSGRWFDIALLLAILASVAIISMETVEGYGEGSASEPWFKTGEWILTLLFTLEYLLRLSCVKRPLSYVFSFWGIIDLLSVLPSYYSFIPTFGDSSRSVSMIRSIRLLRVFRVLKLWRMMSEADELQTAIWRSREKIIVFLIVVMVAVTISGSMMYVIETEMLPPAERDSSDFTSIPQAMYWATVTMTTVGYGDVVPHTAVGKIISAALILLGYSLIIVPTGFVSAELSSRKDAKNEYHPCPRCDVDDHRTDAEYCYRCGCSLDSSRN